MLNDIHYKSEPTLKKTFLTFNAIIKERLYDCSVYNAMSLNGYMNQHLFYVLIRFLKTRCVDKE